MSAMPPTPPPRPPPPPQLYFSFFFFLSVGPFPTGRTHLKDWLTDIWGLSAHFCASCRWSQRRGFFMKKKENKQSKVKRFAAVRAEWRHINSTIQEGLDNNNTKPKAVSPLKVNGRLFSNPENKVEILQQFKSAFSLTMIILLPIPKPLMHHLSNLLRFHLKV